MLLSVWHETEYIKNKTAITVITIVMDSFSNNTALYSEHLDRNIHKVFSILLLAVPQCLIDGCVSSLA